jgi:hypothetical protein
LLFDVNQIQGVRKFFIGLKATLFLLVFDLDQIDGFLKSFFITEP